MAMRLTAKWVKRAPFPENNSYNKERSMRNQKPHKRNHINLILRKIFKESNLENPTLEVFAHSSHIHKRQSIYETINPCDGFHWIYTFCLRIPLNQPPPPHSYQSNPHWVLLSRQQQPTHRPSLQAIWYTCCEVVFHSLHSIK